MTNVTHPRFREQARSIMKTKRQPRIRWHLSESTSAELAYFRKNSSHRSWDEFFKAMLEKWQERKETKPTVSAADETFHREVKHIASELDELHGLLEQMEETSEARLHQEIETRELLQRFHQLFSLAFGGDPEAPEDTHFSQHDPSLAERHELLKKVRRGQITS